MKFLDFIKKYKLYIIIGLSVLILVISSIILVVSLIETDAIVPANSDSTDAVETVASTEPSATSEVVETQPNNQLFYYENEYVPPEMRSNGIDVSKWQGRIDWSKVKESGIEFAFIRVGYRRENGLIYKDEYAEYNLQQASKHGIKIGVYFFSTAISKAEAEEEADYVLDMIAGYPISYPVVYDCEGYKEQTSRMYSISATERTDIALAYLDKISSAGYDAMHYGSRNDLMNPLLWQTYRISQKYKVWVALYSTVHYPEKDTPTYIGRFDAWQYTDSGKVDGINGNVDKVVCYFRCDEATPKNPEKSPEQLIVDPTAQKVDRTIHGVEFYEYYDRVTAKILVNLRSLPSTASGKVVGTLSSGEFLDRVAQSKNGWSILDYNGEEVYAVSSYLTDEVVTQTNNNLGEFIDGFENKPDIVTAKIETNLRSSPSTDSEVVYTLKNGEYVKRIGTNERIGWSMLEHNGSVVYAFSQFLISNDN